MAKQVYHGRFFESGEIESIDDIVNDLVKRRGFDELTAYSLAIDIQRNQMMREALYLYEDGDGPILIEIANAFSAIAKNAARIADHVADLSGAIENLKNDDV